MRARTLHLALALALTGLTFAACNPNGDSRTVGEKIDHAIDRTQQKLAAAGEKIAEQTDKAVGTVKEKVANDGDGANAPAANAPLPSAKTTITPDGKVATDVNAPLPAVTTTVATPETSPAAPASSSRDAKKAMSDTAITASIKTDYLKDPDLSVFKIDVDTRDGVVTLNGLTETEPARQRAERIAQGVKGVREVRNFLVIKRA